MQDFDEKLVGVKVNSPQQNVWSAAAFHASPLCIAVSSVGDTPFHLSQMSLRVIDERKDKRKDKFVVPFLLEREKPHSIKQPVSYRTEVASLLSPVKELEWTGHCPSMRANVKGLSRHFLNG